jgi:hypothetical protein
VILSDMRLFLPVPVARAVDTLTDVAVGIAGRAAGSGGR